MPNNKREVLNIVSSLIPAAAASNHKKFDNYAYSNIVVLGSPTKVSSEQAKRIHLSPHSSCGSSTGSAFSSYCTSSCNSSTCSRRTRHQTCSTNASRSECSTSDSSTIFSSGSSLISCESDCQHSHLSSKTSFNRSSNSNVSSCSSSMSQSASNSPHFSDETTLSENTRQTTNSKKRFTRSSISASDLTINSNSMSRSSSYIGTSPENSENSNATSMKSSSTVVTTKITRSTANSLKAPEVADSFRNGAIKRMDVSDMDVEKRECLWNNCTFVGNSTDVDDSLIEHIKSRHIFSQKDLKRFRCMWRGCSVFKKPAFHFNWLERHVVDHIEKNPFMCIFDGCKRKFRTEEAREKHCQCHINMSENVPMQTQSSSPVKGRNQLLLKSAKLALIQNIKNKNSSVSSNSTKPLMNYSQILKTLAKKRKTQAMTAKKFKKAQFKDFLDDFSIKIIETKLKSLNYESGRFRFSAQIIASQVDLATNEEMFLIQWVPKNIIDNEWIEKKDLGANLSKEVYLSELGSSTNCLNPFYRTHRFRENRRK